MVVLKVSSEVIQTTCSASSLCRLRSASRSSSRHRPEFNPIELITYAPSRPRQSDVAARLRPSGERESVLRWPRLPKETGNAHRRLWLPARDEYLRAAQGRL